MTVLAGRADVLGSLGEALGRADAGQGGLVLLTGEPGIGKTAVARHVSGYARELGGIVGRARVPAVGTGPARARPRGTGALRRGAGGRGTVPVLRPAGIPVRREGRTSSTSVYCGRTVGYHEERRHRHRAGRVVVSADGKNSLGG